MLTFEFEYETNNIIFTIDAWGRESVLIDGQTVHSAIKWSRKNSHHFHVAEHDLLIDCEVVSAMDLEYQVTLSCGGEIIRSEIQTFRFSEIDSDGKIRFNHDEMLWRKEISIGTSPMYFF
ncbi:MAG: hypothetical protein HRU25_10595 [Psychrobium sp.]|nr:hypothetical protein [Psychrobium sp.]